MDSWLEGTSPSGYPPLPEISGQALNLISEAELRRLCLMARTRSDMNNDVTLKVARWVYVCVAAFYYSYRTQSDADIINDELLRPLRLKEVFNLNETSQEIALRTAGHLLESVGGRPMMARPSHLGRYEGNEDVREMALDHFRHHINSEKDTEREVGEQIAWWIIVEGIDDGTEIINLASSNELHRGVEEVEGLFLLIRVAQHVARARDTGAIIPEASGTGSGNLEQEENTAPTFAIDPQLLPPTSQHNNPPPPPPPPQTSTNLPQQATTDNSNPTEDYAFECDGCGHLTRKRADFQYHIRRGLSREVDYEIETIDMNTLTWTTRNERYTGRMVRVQLGKLRNPGTKTCLNAIKQWRAQKAEQQGEQ